MGLFDKYEKARNSVSDAKEALQNEKDLRNVVLEQIENTVLESNKELLREEAARHSEAIRSTRHRWMQKGPGLQSSQGKRDDSLMSNVRSIEELLVYLVATDRLPAVAHNRQRPPVYRGTSRQVEANDNTVSGRAVLLCDPKNIDEWHESRKTDSVKTNDK
jgi:hypothetical protein